MRPPMGTRPSPRACATTRGRPALGGPPSTYHRPSGQPPSMPAARLPASRLATSRLAAGRVTVAAVVAAALVAAALVAFVPFFVLLVTLEDLLLQVRAERPVRAHAALV